MKAPPFDYCRAGSLAEAYAAFDRAEGEGVWLAGGHGLIPALNLRLQAPAMLIDIAHLDELRGVTVAGDGWLRIGALTRHAEVLRDPLIAARAPLLAAAAPFVAHPAIRNRGTLGGNLALADPASEFPAVMRALAARFEIVGPEGARTVGAEDYFLDLFTTAIEPGEILRAIEIPPPAPGDCCAFDELARRRGDYAMSGLAVQARLMGGHVAALRLAFCAMGPVPMRAFAAEAALTGARLDNGRLPADAIAAAQAALGDDLDPADDAQLSGAARLHLARVLTGRVLARLEEPA